MESVVRVGVLASGGGTTFEAAREAQGRGEMPGVDIAFVISNNSAKNPDAKVWERAERLGVPIFHVSNLTQRDRTFPVVDGEPAEGTISYEASAMILHLAKEHGAGLMFGLGFMKKVIGVALEELPFANEHPGPLGKDRLTAGYHSDGVQKRVMELGLQYSGPTMHWMDKRLDECGLPAYDMGAEIGHEPVYVNTDMRREWERYGTVTKLKEKVMETERQMVPQWMVEAVVQLQVA